MDGYLNPIIISLIVGITQVIKTAGLPKKFAPLVSLGIGIVLCIVYETNVDIKKSILDGIIAGLTASGLFSGYKSVSKCNKK
ncbi:holin [Tepidibacter mesophilus]|uniref:holin n=1 Tax=Tepidibacter mesophilus TaxID=655607 RepID=UPI000C06CEE4|nr:holin [Tepidibacter mesophilus]